MNAVLQKHFKEQMIVLQVQIFGKRDNIVVAPTPEIILKFERPAI